MALEIKKMLSPSYISIIYDDVSKLAREEHTEGFFVVSKAFFEKVLILFGDNIELLLKKNYCTMYPLGGWVPLKNLLSEEANFLSIIYYNIDERSEFNARLKTEFNMYDLLVCTDPVVFSVTRAKKRFHPSRFGFLGWFKRKQAK